VITRTGSAAKLEDLRRAAASVAATVLVQYPEGKERVRVGRWGELLGGWALLGG